MTLILGLVFFNLLLLVKLSTSQQFLQTIPNIGSKIGKKLINKVCLLQHLQKLKVISMSISICDPQLHLYPLCKRLALFKQSWQQYSMQLLEWGCAVLKSKSFLQIKQINLFSNFCLQMFCYFFPSSNIKNRLSGIIKLHFLHEKFSFFVVEFPIFIHFWKISSKQTLWKIHPQPFKKLGFGLLQ